MNVKKKNFKWASVETPGNFLIKMNLPTSFENQHLKTQFLPELEPLGNIQLSKFQRNPLLFNKLIFI